MWPDWKGHVHPSAPSRVTIISEILWNSLFRCYLVNIWCFKFWILFSGHHVFAFLISGNSVQFNSTSLIPALKISFQNMYYSVLGAWTLQVGSSSVTWSCFPCWPFATKCLLSWLFHLPEIFLTSQFLTLLNAKRTLIHIYWHLLRLLTCLIIVHAVHIHSQHTWYLQALTLRLVSGSHQLKLSQLRRCMKSQAVGYLNAMFKIQTLNFCTNRPTLRNQIPGWQLKI